MLPASMLHCTIIAVIAMDAGVRWGVCYTAWVLLGWLGRVAARMNRHLGRHVGIEMRGRGAA